MNFLSVTRRMMSSLPTKRVEFFYDVASPYSWFSFEVLQRYKKYWNMDLCLQPVLLGGIFKDSNNKSPLMVSAAKAVHMADDLKRCAVYYDVPLKQMQHVTDLMTKGSVAPMRFLTAVKSVCPQHLEESSRKFWMLRWNRDTDFTTPEALKEVTEACGMTSEEANLVLSKVTSDEVKLKLKENTEYSVKLGLFGVPSMVLHDGEQKLFFGSDRFPILAQEMQEEWKGPNPDKSSKL